MANGGTTYWKCVCGETLNSRKARDHDCPALWQDCPICRATGRSPVPGYYGESRRICETCDGEGVIPSLLALSRAHYDFEQEVADLLDTTTDAAKILLRQLHTVAIRKVEDDL